jgi:hypothetical protein
MLRKERQEGMNAATIYPGFTGAIYEFNSLSFLPTAPGPKLI